jgi:F-type H+-transporting ATPase subunit a
MPFGINVTGNLTITFALAIMTFLITNLTANKKTIGHIFWMPGVPVMRIVLAPIELLGVIIKPFINDSFVCKHFCRTYCIDEYYGLMFIFKSWLGSTLSFDCRLHFLSRDIGCILQAYIFTLLSALYFGSAVEETTMRRLIN